MTGTPYNTSATLENAIYSWLTSMFTADPTVEVPSPTLSMKILWARRSATQPRDPYIALNLTAPGIQIGSDDASEDTADYRYLNGRRECQLSVQAYGDDAYEALFALKQSLDIERSRGLLRAANLSLIDHGNIVDLSELRDVNFQRRGQIDLRIGYTTNRITGSGYVAKIGITNKVSDPESEIEVEPE